MINLQINCDKASKVIEYAKSKIGCGYSMLGTGQICTEELIKRYPNTYGRATKWIGKQIFSANGLVTEAFNQVGIKIFYSLNSAWEQTDWQSKGDMSNFPNKVCILYKKGESLMVKAGIYIGNGEYIHAKGYEDGVVKGKMPGEWTHWGIPKGLYDNESDQDKSEEKITNFPCQAKVIASLDKIVDIRKSPSKNSSILFRIKFGTTVTITGEENDWYEVIYESTKGYIMKEFLGKA